jgi:5,6-dimethylbenzimidazole synthase
VAAITQFWLAARAHGLGLGWVSILDPAEIAGITGVPPEWKLIGYLCLGYPEEEHEVPELVRAGWESDPRRN